MLSVVTASLVTPEKDIVTSQPSLTPINVIPFSFSSASISLSPATTSKLTFGRDIEYV